MNELACQTVLERLSAPGTRIEDQGPQEALQAHLASCAACRDGAALLGTLDATRAEPLPAVLVGFSARVRVRLAANEVKERKRAPLRSALLTGALSACGAAAVVFALNLGAPQPSLLRLAAPPQAAEAAEPSALDWEDDDLEAFFALDEGPDHGSRLATNSSGGGEYLAAIDDPLEGLDAAALARLERLLERY